MLAVRSTPSQSSHPAGNSPLLSLLQGGGGRGAVQLGRAPKGKGEEAKVGLGGGDEEGVGVRGLEGGGGRSGHVGH